MLRLVQTPELEPAVASSPHAVTVVRRARETGEERTFHLVGTAHVSRRSVAEVRELILAVRPDTVCVELCPTRFAALTDETRWRSLDVAAIVRQDRAGFVLATLALQSFQQRMGERLGVKPGAELLAATEAAREIGAELVLADRDAQITLRRAWANLGLAKRGLLAAGLAATALGSDDIDEADVEALKQREHVSDVMSELGKKLPEVKVPLIDERDRYLTSRIEESPGRTVVAVVGAGHVEGMLKSFGVAVDRGSLESIPPPRGRDRLASFVPLALAALGALVAHRHGVTTGTLAVAWLVPTTAALGLLLLAARARLETWLVALVTAPLLALVPGAGSRVLGGLEVALRAPSAADGARLGKDLARAREALANPVLRSLLVAVAAGQGALLGRLVAAAWLAVLALTG